MESRKYSPLNRPCFISCGGLRSLTEDFLDLRQKQTFFLLLQINFGTTRKESQISHKNIN